MIPRIKITQYGYPNDPDGDTLTEQGWGCWDNRLVPELSCALTDSLRDALGAKPHAKLRIAFSNGLVLTRRFDDRAPEQDERLDLYQPGGFEKTLPDFADVSLEE